MMATIRFHEGSARSGWLRHNTIARMRLKAAPGILLLAALHLPASLEASPGGVRWQFYTGGEVRSCPALGVDGTVCVGSHDGKVYALDGASGIKRWEFVTGSWVESSPVIGGDGTVYLGSYDQRVYALDGATGVKRWEYLTGAAVSSSPAIGVEGRLYVGSRDGKVYALDAGTGAKRWEYLTGDCVDSSPAIGADGTVYAGSWDNKVYALDGASGAKRWEFVTGGWVLSSPAIGADGTVYVGSRDGMVYALDGTTGLKRWEFVTGGWVDSSPAIGADGTVYVGSFDGCVYALEGASGLLRWHFVSGGWVQSSPAIGSDGTVYVGSWDHTLYALDGATGAERWGSRWGGGTHSPTIGPDGTVYVGSSGNGVYAFEGSAPLAQSPWPKVHGDTSNAGAAQRGPANSLSPTITIQPQGRTNAVGSDVRLWAWASATRPRTFQWRKDGEPLSESGRVAGAQSPTLQITNLQLSDMGAYAVVITNPAGAATSVVAQLVAGYSLNLTNVGAGTAVANPAAEIYEPGAAVELTARPAAGERFLGWRGDAVGLTNRLWLAMDRNKRVVARFSSPPGRKLWEFTTSGYVRSCPAIGADGTVYVGSSDWRVYALDGASGLERWEFVTAGGVDSSPAVGADGTVYVGSYDRKVYALDGATGVKRWEFVTGGGVESSPAVGADGTVYVGSYDEKVYALDGATGAKRWDATARGVGFSSPAIGSDGTVYVGSYGGTVYALDGASGIRRWEFVTNGWVLSSPAIGADGTVHVESRDGKVYALDGATGLKRWEFHLGSEGYSSPAVGANGTVYLGSGGKLYAVDGATGYEQWESAAGIGVYSSPAIGADGTVYFGSPWPDSRLYALDGLTGIKLWDFTGAQGNWHSPAIGPDGTIFASCGDNKLYALASTSVGGLAKSPWPKFHANARNTGVVELKAPPALSRQANTRFLLENHPGLLHQSATGWPTPEFRWFFNGSPIPGGTNASYVIDSVTPADEGVYTVTLSNALGQAASQPIHVFVANREVDRYAGLTFEGAGGGTSRLEYRTVVGRDNGWSVLTNLALPAAPFVFIDFGSRSDAQRFYRATEALRLGIGLYNAWTWTDPVGTRYQVDFADAGSGATNWQSLTNLTLPSSPYVFIDYTATNALQRFYRVR